jgi:hypothetical protein
VNIYDAVAESNRRSREERRVADKAHMVEMEKTRALNAHWCDPRVTAFKARRALQANQIRYWDKLGKELPRTRKFATSQSLAALKQS